MIHDLRYQGFFVEDFLALGHGEQKTIQMKKKQWSQGSAYGDIYISPTRLGLRPRCISACAVLRLRS